MPIIPLKRRYFHEKWLLFLSSKVKKRSNFHKIRLLLNFEPVLSNQIITLCKRWDTPGKTLINQFKLSRFKSVAYFKHWDDIQNRNFSNSTSFETLSRGVRYLIETISASVVVAQRSRREKAPPPIATDEIGDDY